MYKCQDNLARKPIHGERSAVAKSSPDDNQNEEERKTPNKLYPDASELCDSVPISEEHDIPKSEESLKERKRKTAKREEHIEDDEKNEKSSKGKEKVDEQRENHKHTIFLYIFILFVLLGFLWYESQEGTSVVVSEVNVEELLKELQAKYKNQPRLTFAVLSGSLKSVTSLKNCKPAAITFLIDKGAYEVAKGMSLSIVEKISPSNHIILDKSLNSHTSVKQYLLHEIEKKFNNSANDIGAVIVEHFENFDLESAMLFHDYCDENAPYKSIVYIFLMHMEHIIANGNNPKVVDRKAIEVFRNIWGKVSHPDDYESLISRLTGYVANVKGIQN